MDSRNDIGSLIQKPEDNSVLAILRVINTDPQDKKGITARIRNDFYRYSGLLQYTPATGKWDLTRLGHDMLESGKNQFYIQ